jgi:NedA-like, galactose-binding domain
LGDHLVTYEFTDNCGNLAQCSFNINIDGGDTTDCDQLTNLALSGAASQSSTRFGAGPERAIDGNTSGNFWLDYSVSHTEWEFNAWWEVDLGAVYNLKYTNIWNRTDCCQKWLSNFYILVSEEPFGSTDLDETLSDPGVCAFYQADEVGLPTTMALDCSGRYVRIQLADQAFLAMAEVEIMGCPIADNRSNLLYFGADITESFDVSLQWINYTQTKNDYFEIQKSEDGVQFETLLTRDGAGPANVPQFYRAFDRNPVEGNNYYRLKLVYKDGSFEYSRIVDVVFNPESNFTVFPNPTDDGVSVYLDRFLGKEVDLLIVNPLGQVVFKQHFDEVIDKLFYISLDSEKYFDGLYTVTVVHRGRALSKRLVISRF